VVLVVQSVLVVLVVLQDYPVVLAVLAVRLDLVGPVVLLDLAVLVVLRLDLVVLVAQ
jgi:hypothetical protein